MKHIAIALLYICGAKAAGREVAITIDDLPRGGDSGCAAAPLLSMTEKLMKPLREGRIPVTGFVNGQRCPEVQEQALRIWLDAGAELGNHTYSHVDLNSVTASEFITDIVRGEHPIENLTGVKATYFRYPFLHLGDETQKRQAVIDYLRTHGCRNAPVTLDNSDYMFARVYAMALRKGDPALARKVTDAYIPYMEAIFEFFEKRSAEVTGHEVRQTLLIHASQLNADMMPQMLEMMKRRGYRFVSLARALDDAAYQLPERFVGRGGFSWIHRWAMAAGRKFPTYEPDEPKWIGELWNAKPE